MKQSKPTRTEPARAKKLTVRFTEGELEALRHEAAKMGVKPSALARGLIHQGLVGERVRPKLVASPGDIRIAQELSRIGNNINQAVYAGHRQGYFNADIFIRIEKFGAQAYEIARQLRQPKGGGR